jgi:hypothetical protein
MRKSSSLHKTDKIVPKDTWTIQPGEKYGTLLVISEPFYGKYRTGGSLQCVFVRCKCGTERMAISSNLTRGITKRCCIECKEKSKNLNKKRCSVCKQYKSSEKFYKNKSTYDGIHPECKECKEFKTLERKYGINKEEYLNLVKKQNNKCAICNKEQRVHKEQIGQKKRLSVDHDHKTNKIRGLLCDTCNRAIGLLGDDLVIVRNALTYLEKEALC